MERGGRVGDHPFKEPVISRGHRGFVDDYVAEFWVVSVLPTLRMEIKKHLDSNAWVEPAKLESELKVGFFEFFVVVPDYCGCTAVAVSSNHYAGWLLEPDHHFNVPQENFQSLFAILFGDGREFGSYRSASKADRMNNVVAKGVGHFNAAVAAANENQMIFIILHAQLLSCLV